MKTIYRLTLLVLNFLFMASCSVEDLIKEEPSNADILSTNSPWRFESYKVAWVIKTEKDTITEKEIEMEINGLYENLEFNFKEDGTGITTFPDPDEEPHTWTWFFSGDEICFDGVCDGGNFSGIKLTESSFSFDSTAESPSNTEGEKIIYSGRFTFK